jgi:hypothetical protein
MAPSIFRPTAETIQRLLQKQSRYSFTDLNLPYGQNVVAASPYRTPWWAKPGEPLPVYGPPVPVGGAGQPMLEIGPVGNPGMSATVTNPLASVQGRLASQAQGVIGEAQPMYAQAGRFAGAGAGGGLTPGPITGPPLAEIGPGGPAFGSPNLPVYAQGPMAGPPLSQMNPYGGRIGIKMNGTPYTQENLVNAGGAAGETGAGEGAGILARLGFGGEGAAATSGYGQFLKAGLTPKTAFAKFSVPATAGYLASSYIVDPLNIGGKNSGVDRFLTGATTGAGVGAGIGSIIPIPGISTAVGAGIGALLGGTANTIKGWFDDRGMTEVSKKNQQRYVGLTGLMDTAGLTQRQREALMSQYNTQMQLVGDDTKAQKLLLDSLEQQVVGLAGSNPYQVTGQDLIGLQAQIQDYMRPLQERMSATSSGLAAAYNNIASQMQSPQLADAMRLQGANVQAAADRQILANAQSASSLPASYGLQMNNLVRSQIPSASSSLASQMANAGG